MDSIQRLIDESAQEHERINKLKATGDYLGGVDPRALFIWRLTITRSSMSWGRTDIRDWTFAFAFRDDALRYFMHQVEMDDYYGEALGRNGLFKTALEEGRLEDAARVITSTYSAYQFRLYSEQLHFTPAF